VPKVQGEMLNLSGKRIEYKQELVDVFLHFPELLFDFSAVFFIFRKEKKNG